MRFPFFKEFLGRAGVLVSPRMIHYANGMLNYLNLGRWFRDQKLAIPFRGADREALYQYLARSLPQPVSYLEFGVFKGTTMRQWLRLLPHPENTFDGFDSFEGLPEDWGLFTAKEVFDVGGQIPRFDDPRVHLHKGWFSDTLPPFLGTFRARPTLVLHLDADLYSSTIFALRQMRPFMQPGTVLIFDEFFDREHELKAFAEFLGDEHMGIKCLGATRALSQAAFQIVSLAPRPVPQNESLRPQA